MVNSETMYLLTVSISLPFMLKRATLYAQAINNKTSGLPNSVCSINGTTIAVARSSWWHMVQMVAYNVHKRKYGLKLQSVIGPDGFIHYAFGRIEARRYDWALCGRINWEQKLPQVRDIGSVQYCL